MGQRHNPWSQANPVGDAAPIRGRQAENRWEEDEEAGNEEALKGGNHLGPLRQNKSRPIRAIKNCQHWQNPMTRTYVQLSTKTNKRYLRAIKE